MDTIKKKDKLRYNWDCKWWRLSKNKANSISVLWQWPYHSSNDTPLLFLISFWILISSRKIQQIERRDSETQRRLTHHPFSFYLPSLSRHVIWPQKISTAIWSRRTKNWLSIPNNKDNARSDVTLENGRRWFVSVSYIYHFALASLDVQSTLHGTCLVN